MHRTHDHPRWPATLSDPGFIIDSSGYSALKPKNFFRVTESALIIRITGEEDLIGLVILVDDDRDTMPSVDRLEEIHVLLDHLAGRMGRAVQLLQELVRDRGHGAEFRLVGDLVEVQDRACSVGVRVIKGFFNRGVLRSG